MAERTVPASHFVKCDRCGKEVEKQAGNMQGWTRLGLVNSNGTPVFRLDDKVLDLCLFCTSGVIEYLKTGQK